MASEKRWVVKDYDETIAEKLRGELGVTPEIAALLAMRGIESFEQAKTFFRPDLTAVHDPFLMEDMDLAVDRIEEAFGNGERVMIYGDYDVDGTTSVALVYDFFKEHTDQIEYYIPDRYTEGYGVSMKSIDHAASQGVELIICLDCGIKAIEQVAYAKSKGIDFIICDHHRPGKELPDAVAILDPKKETCSYPYKELCGCGVGFKLVTAFTERNGLDYQKAYAGLDLVAIAIGCDIVPITGENRILAHYGLQKMEDNPTTAIKQMISLNKLGSSLTITDLVFTIGPRINAAGRIFHGKKAVELLVSSSEQEAEDICVKINEFNEERKGLDKQITKQALEMIAGDSRLLEAKSTVVFQEDWHKGVVGIVASRLTETYYRPTIVLTSSEGVATGSARSVKDFDVYDAIDACGDLLDQFGGHKYAAGLTLPVANVAAFREKFNEVVSASIDPELLVPQVEVDLVVNLPDINWKLFKILDQFEPFGPENLAPIFMTTGCLDAGGTRTVGNDKSHLKISVYQPGNTAYKMDGIAFGLGHLADDISNGAKFDLVYSVSVNEWRGKKTLQLMVKDIRLTGN